MGIEMKACSKCKVVKSLAEFGKKERNKDGLQSNCKACAAACNAKYRANNKEQIAAYNANNKELIAARMAKYRANNKELMAARMVKYYATAISTLSSAYVRSLINLRGMEIPQELIELKRIQILIKRELKK
jgi:hypothetical protein